MTKNTEENLYGVVGILIIVSWIAHLVVCFTTSAWGFLIAGAILFPIGIVHGFGAMVGFW